ncbi:MAG: hypothetical protein AAGE65_06670 [Planctomycetota bacterium]
MKLAPFQEHLSPIRYDFACRRCSYSLRALRFDGDCPECGQPVFRSAAHIAHDIEALDWNRSGVPETFAPSSGYQQAIAVAAGVAQVAPDMLAFVVDTNVFIDFALRPPGVDERRDTPRDPSAATYAQALLHFAAVYFGDRAPETLRRWGLHHSRGLGHALTVLVRAGVLKTEPGDDFQDFETLYELSDETQS